MKIVLATHNKGKIAEFQTLFGDLDFELTGLDGFPNITEVEECGRTFAENARAKAAGYAVQCGLHSIADDSGLEVKALDGRPGVLSARFAGRETKYEEKIRRLLEEIELSKSGDRDARFVAHIALASPDGEIIFEAEGICEGRICREARGSNGFGYDPIFIPNGYDRTFAELPDQIKKSISHRAAAAVKIMRFLRDFA